MKIKVLGAHNTESRKTRNTCLLVDGILALDAGGLTSSLSFRDQMKIKAVLLTHGHYDHIRDIPALAMNCCLRGKSIDIYTHQAALDNLKLYLLNGVVYPEFHKVPAANPTLKMHLVEPCLPVQIEGYTVLAATVTHALPSVGYQVTSSEGRSIFYTGDTGASLDEVWKQVSPHVLFVELTGANRWEEAMKHSGHLTPRLLQQELARFREIKGYLPEVCAVHLNPEGESEITAEISAVESSLGISIGLAREGMRVEV
jgi:ribonuclease BN (tRNA processing enzyme)